VSGLPAPSRCPVTPDGGFFVDGPLWRMSYSSARDALPLADRHYSRKTPGSHKLTPPGRCLVLMAAWDLAIWATSWPAYSNNRWPGAWINSLFRREGGPPASVLIRQAVAATRWYWPEVPALGMVTFVDPAKIRPRRAGWGKCYLKAGFQEDGRTQCGSLALRMPPDRMPPPMAPAVSALFLEAGSAYAGAL